MWVQIQFKTWVFVLIQKWIRKIRNPSKKSQEWQNNHQAIPIRITATSYFVLLTDNCVACFFLVKSNDHIRVKHWTRLSLCDFELKSWTSAQHNSAEFLFLLRQFFLLFLIVMMHQSYLLLSVVGDKIGYLSFRYARLPVLVIYWQSLLSCLSTCY